MKTCLQCKMEKLIDDFHFNKNKKDGRSIYCKTCSSINSKKYTKRVSGKTRKPTSESKRNYMFKYKHGFERNDALKILEQQGGCKICNKTLDEKINKWYLDHDHKCCPNLRSCENCRRGILCRECNLMLGLAKDDINVLLEAIKYLEQYNKEKVNANI